MIVQDKGGGARHAWEEKILSVKGRGRPSLTGFIYTSDLAQTFASRVVRSAGPVNLRGDRHGLPRERTVFRRNHYGCTDLLSTQSITSKGELDFSHETNYRDGWLMTDYLRVPRAVSICVNYNRHNVITWFYRYYIIDNSNKVADSEVLRDSAEKSFGIKRWIGWQSI
jgi:hypothetical protein